VMVSSSMELMTASGTARPYQGSLRGRCHGDGRLRRRLVQPGSTAGLRSSPGPGPPLDAETVALASGLPSEHGRALPRSGTGPIVNVLRRPTTTAVWGQWSVFCAWPLAGSSFARRVSRGDAIGATCSHVRGCPLSPRARSALAGSGNDREAPRRASSPPWPPARHKQIGAVNAGRSIPHTSTSRAVRRHLGMRRATGLVVDEVEIPDLCPTV
jgi:hypothetical protein